MTSFCSNVMKWSARSLPSRPGGFKSYRLNFLNSSAWQKASAEPGPIETRRTFSETGSALKQQQQSLEKSNPAPKPRISAGKASLRGVAAEAQWSRSGFIRGKGRRQFVDPEVETKVCLCKVGCLDYGLTDSVYRKLERIAPPNSTTS